MKLEWGAPCRRSYSRNEWQKANATTGFVCANSFDSRSPRQRTVLVGYLRPFSTIVGADADAAAEELVELMVEALGLIS